jgi:hypothetical protein
MSASLATGVLTISIDLEDDAAHAAHDRLLEAVTERLLELLAAHKLPATWAVSDPAVSAARWRLAATSAGHELAILGDASWVGREAGRTRFARELIRRTARARQQGSPIETLVLRSDMPISHCDLAIKEGIIAARHQGQVGGGRPLPPRPLRFGLWGFPVSIALPGTSRIWPGGGGARAAKLTIDEAVGARGLVHLAIDAPRLAARGNWAVRVLDRVLDHAARRRRHALLEVATLGTVARKLADENRGRPSRSILRPAA